MAAVSLILGASLMGLTSVGLGAAEPTVTVLRVPHHGLQPQAAVDGQGGLHVIYLRGNPGAADIYYMGAAPGSLNFSEPIRVNSQAGSAIAIGSVRGPQLALGKGGRVHVAWMGSKEARPARAGGKEVVPMEYARLDDAGTAFEPERNLITWAPGLDGGGAIAADGKGNVYVAWHGHAPSAPAGEAGRAVFVTHSANEGRTFSSERQASPPGLGACACCGMRALADSRGRLFLCYRSAEAAGTERNMTLLISMDGGRSFSDHTLSRWKLRTCPMSTAGLSEAGPVLYAAWEWKQEVQFCPVQLSSGRPGATITPPGAGHRKHPALARNGRGQVLLAWLEDTGWAKGGTLAWRLFDRKGAPMGRTGHRAGVPAWDLASAVALADGNFLILY